MFDFKMACESMKNEFPIFSEQLKKELKDKVFSHNADYDTLRSQYDFLKTLEQRIINETKTQENN